VRKFFSPFFKYNTYLLFVVYCSIASLFIKFQNDDMLTRLRTSGIATSAFITDKLGSYSYLFNLKNENERLMLVNTALLSRVLALEAALGDEHHPQETESTSTLKTTGFIEARVVDRKFSDRENMLLINAGWRDGIKKDMTVLVPEGLVGRVTAVSEHYARVMPVIHTDFKVSVISTSSNSMGLLSWNGGREFIAQVEHIPISSLLKLNEEMVTTDFSTFAPRGIAVGRVVRIKPDKLFYSVDIRLAVDFSSLTHVLVAPLKIDQEKIEMMSDKIPNEELP
jgi:rod shape-determining protein MreC